MMRKERYRVPVQQLKSYSVNKWILLKFFQTESGKLQSSLIFSWKWRENFCVIPPVQRTWRDWSIWRLRKSILTRRSILPTELWLTENLLKNSRYVLPDLSTMAGETMCSFWELQSTWTSGWQSSWWGKHLRILFTATKWIYMLLDLFWWRLSCLVESRSDYKGHQSKKASKDFIYWYSL